jgi:ferritin
MTNSLEDLLREVVASQELPTASLLQLPKDDAHTPENSAQALALMEVPPPKIAPEPVGSHLGDILKEVSENMERSMPTEKEPISDAGGGAKMAEDRPKQVEILQKILAAKYKLMISYANYGDGLRHWARDGIWHHFQEHLKEERDNAYEIAKRLTAMGESIKVKDISLDDVDYNQPKSVFKKILELEEEGVAAFQELFALTKDDAAMNALAQDGAQLDTQHADDMRRYLREVE